MNKAKRILEMLFVNEELKKINTPPDERDGDMWFKGKDFIYSIEEDRLHGKSIKIHAYRDTSRLGRPLAKFVYLFNSKKWECSFASRESDVNFKLNVRIPTLKNNEERENILSEVESLIKQLQNQDIFGVKLPLINKSDIDIYNALYVYK